jgi:putative nucleotidyltransferase with HDIG domain
VEAHRPRKPTRGRWRTASSWAEIALLAERLARKDPYLASHGRVVGEYASLTARALGVPRATADSLRLAGELHDIGKLELPRRILDKPGPLNEREWAWVKTHPTVGASMIREAGLDQIAEWVFAHHERPDGLGYPLGIDAALIPIEAGVLAVADAYHAMTSERPYKAAMGPDAALAELRRGSGTQFDPIVVDAFIPAMTQSQLDTADL